MLVLTRKNGESIKIGDDIEIKIVESYKNSVKIGINAPKELLVLRNELANQIANTNKEATNSDSASLSELSKKIKK